MELGGTGSIPISASEGSSYILMLLKNWQTTTKDGGKTFRIVVVWSQYQVRTSYFIFQHTDTNLDYIMAEFVPL